jgi:hypothetical protein
MLQLKELDRYKLRVLSTSKKYLFQQCGQGGADKTTQLGSDGETPGKDPAIVGLSLESHYDLLLASLLHVKARWFELGMKLNLSENFLDETETNMDSVEECLGEMLQNWLLYHHPTMETLNNALSRMNLSPITFNTTSSEFVSFPE